MTLLQSFLVLVLACSISEVGGIGNMCLSSQLSSLDSSNGQLNGNKQIILPTMNFSSCGVIQNWVVRADGRVAGNLPNTITLQLFRPDNMAASVFTQVSSTVVQTAIPNAVTAAYTFSDVGLQFSPGFVLGMKLPSRKFVGLHYTSYATHFYAQIDNPKDSTVVTVVTVGFSRSNSFPVMSVSVVCSECPTTSAPMATASTPELMSTQTAPVSSVSVDGSSSERTSQDGAASSIASSPTPTASVLPSPVSSSFSSPLTTSDSSSSPSSFPLTMSSPSSPSSSPLATSSPSSPSSSFLTMSVSSSFANSALSSFSSPSILPISTPTSVMSSPNNADQAVTTEPTSEPDGTPDPSSIVMAPLGSTSGPGVAIGVCIAAVLVLVLVVVFVIVLVAVCITRKNRNYELPNSPMYNTPPDAYCTFGSKRAMVPQNGHELVAMSSSYDEVESVPSAFVIGNNSAAVYITPTAQPSATAPLDSLYTSLNVPDVPQLYTQLNTATKPDKTTQSATDPMDSQYTSLKVPDVPQLYTQLNTATKPGEYIYCNSLDKRSIPIPSELYEEVRIPNHDTEGTTDSDHEYI